ncbi:MAG: 50S ribosomal protein L10 [Candidatus Dormibacteria bacterium]
MANVQVHVTRTPAHKRDVVAELTDKFERATSALVTDYRGLTVKELEELRTQLRSEQVEYVVAKNTLARRAANEAKLEALVPALKGPSGLVVGYGEVTTPARLIMAFAKANKALTVSGGVIEGSFVSESEVKQLADLPSKDVLLAQLAGTLQSPLTQLAGSLESIMSTFAATLEAYRDSRS